MGISKELEEKCEEQVAELERLAELALDETTQKKAESILEEMIAKTSSSKSPKYFKRIL